MSQFTLRGASKYVIIYLQYQQHLTLGHFQNQVVDIGNRVIAADL